MLWRIVDKKIEITPRSEGVYLKLILQDDEGRRRELVMSHDTWQRARIGDVFQ